MAKKILIIEDDKVLAETLQAILADSGLYEISLAYNGETGLRLAEEFKPDLIILDLLMSGTTGLDLLAKWNETGLSKHIPITVATNLYQLQIMNHAIELGAKNYFLKSEMSPESIVQHCQNLLATTSGSQPPTT